MAAFGFLRLLALVYPIFAIREAVEKDPLQHYEVCMNSDTRL